LERYDRKATTTGGTVASVERLKVEDKFSVTNFHVKLSIQIKIKEQQKTSEA
jgi:hypothetical protein